MTTSLGRQREGVNSEWRSMTEQREPGGENRGNRLISVICVFNNRDILEKALLNGLSCQTESHEVILLDNTCSAYPSAAAALNEGAAPSEW